MWFDSASLPRPALLFVVVSVALLLGLWMMRRAQKRVRASEAELRGAASGEPVRWIPQEREPAEAPSPPSPSAPPRGGDVPPCSSPAPAPLLVRLQKAVGAKKAVAPVPCAASVAATMAAIEAKRASSTRHGGH